MSNQIRYLLISVMIIATGLLFSVAYLSRAHADVERVGKPDVLTTKKAQKDNMKQLMKDAKKAFTDADQQTVIIKIIKELGGTE